MKKLLLLLSFISVFTFTSCTEDETNDVGITSYMFLKSETSLPTFENEVSTTEIVIASTTKSSVDRVVSVVVDAANSTATASQYTLEASQVVIPAGSYISSTTIKVAGVYSQLPVEGEETVVLKIEEGLNVVSSNASNTVSLFRACPSNPVVLNIDFDAWASEIGWTLIQSPNIVIASVAQGTYTDVTTTNDNRSFCLPAGTYTFTISDSYGDGIDTGTYTMTNTKNTPNVVLFSGTGSFGSINPPSFIPGAPRTHTFTLQ